MTYETPETGDADASSRPSIGRLFGGRYKAERELGSGALGTVYVARHEVLGRDVALKLMHADLAARPAVAERFEREAQSLAKLRHPNIVTVLDFGVEGDAIYLVTELAEGQTLDQVVAQEAPPLEVGIAIVRQLLRAIAFAHAQELLHLDLKPSNVIVRRLTENSVHVVVLDFGIAAILGDGTQPGASRAVHLASPYYMAPEQAGTAAPRAATDVYTLGLIVFEVLTGKRPFGGADAAAIVRAHTASAPPMPSSIRPEIASIAGLDAFVLKALEKKPAHRYRDAGQMIEALEKLVGGASASEFRTSSAGISLVDITGSFATGEGARGSLEPSRTTASPTAPTEHAVVVPPAVAQAPSTPRMPVAPPPRRSGSGAGAFVVATLLFLAAVAGVGYLAVKKQIVPASAIPIPIPGVTDEADDAPASGTTPLDRGIPDELAELHDRIVAGDKPSRSELQALYRYNSAHLGDARGLLLLGRTATDRRWFSDATEAYLEACRRDPSSAGYSRLRQDLVRFVPLERFGAAAADAVDECLGVGAVSEVDRALSTANTPDARQRLQDLSLRLRSAH